MTRTSHSERKTQLVESMPAKKTNSFTSFAGTNADTDR
jgi:hypothetical protein